MTWIALVSFSLAIALWFYSQQHTDEVIAPLVTLMALTCALAGLITTPWLLKILIFIGLLAYPICHSCHRLPKRTCQQFCLWRDRCNPNPQSYKGLQLGPSTDQTHCPLSDTFR